MEKENKFSKPEELANAYSHLLGTLLAMAGLVIMLIQARTTGSAIHIVTSAVFGGSMVLLYFSSTMTHILPMGRLKDAFFNMDRIAIYLLIAGTYTPIALVGIGGTLGWVIFAVEWGIALTGTLLILFKPGDYDSGVNIFYVISYAVMGWLFLFGMVPMIRNLPTMAWLWILIGGIIYSIGILFFKFIKFPFHHLVWHILVIAGSLSHFFAVYFYLIPR